MPQLITEQFYTDVMPSKSIFVCGDFNTDHLKLETHNGTKRFLDCMCGLGLYPLINRQSQIITDSCTLIYNIFTNQTNYLVRTCLLNGYEDVDRNMFFKPKEGSRTRGHKAALVKEPCRLDMRKYSFSQRVKNEWNKLPNDCVNASSVNIMFKNRIDIYLIRAGYT